MTDFEIITGFVGIVGLIAAFGLGVIAGCVRWSGQRRDLKQALARIGELEDDLAEADAVLARVTSGSDDIIRAARGAHHRTQEADRG